MDWQFIRGAAVSLARIRDAEPRFNCRRSELLCPRAGALAPARTQILLSSGYAYAARRPRSRAGRQVGRGRAVGAI